MKLDHSKIFIVKKLNQTKEIFGRYSGMLKTPRGKKIGAATAGAVLLFPLVFVGFQNMTAPPIGNPNPTPRPTIAPLHTPTPTPTPSPTPIAKVFGADFGAYMQNTAMPDTNHVIALATADGYKVTVNGTPNVPPFSVDIADPNNSANYFSIWSEPIVKVETPWYNPFAQTCIGPSNVPINFFSNGDCQGYAPPAGQKNIVLNITGAASAYTQSIQTAASAMSTDTSGSGADPISTTSNQPAGPGNVGVYCDSSLPWTATNQVLASTVTYASSNGNFSGGATIQINCNHLGNQDISEVIYHELGHLLGLGDNTQTPTDTMYQAVNGQSLSSIRHLSNSEYGVLKQIYSPNVNDMVPIAACKNFTPFNNLTGGGTNPTPVPTAPPGCAQQGCSGDAVWEPAACACICELTQCPSGYNLNSSACDCEQTGYSIPCGGKTCPGGSVLDDQSCQCVADCDSNGCINN